MTKENDEDRSVVGFVSEKPFVRSRGYTNWEDHQHLYQRINKYEIGPDYERINREKKAEVGLYTQVPIRWDFPKKKVSGGGFHADGGKYLSHYTHHLLQRIH